MTSMLKFIPDCKGFLKSMKQHNEKVITSLQFLMHKVTWIIKKYLLKKQIQKYRTDPHKYLSS